MGLVAEQVNMQGRDYLVREYVSDGDRACRQSAHVLRERMYRQDGVLKRVVDHDEKVIIWFVGVDSTD
jgi:hypothetical protein